MMDVVQNYTLHLDGGPPWATGLMNELNLLQYTELHHLRVEVSDDYDGGWYTPDLGCYQLVTARCGSLDAVITCHDEGAYKHTFDKDCSVSKAVASKQAMACLANVTLQAMYAEVKQC